MEPSVSNRPEETDPSELPYIENGGRREYKEWFKMQMVDECRQPGASVSVVARRHNVNTNVLFRWRREFQLGILRPTHPPRNATFASVGMIGEDGKLVPPTSPQLTIEQPPPRLPHVQSGSSSVKALPAPSASPASRSPPVGVIELQLNGRIKMRIEGDVDKNTLRSVLAVARDFA